MAKAGFSVRLYEKATFPRAKLCGGYLSAEALPEFQQLDIWDDVLSAGAWPTHRVLVSAPSGIQACTPLSAPAYSLSRYRLDRILLQRARDCGVDVREGQFGAPSAQPEEASYTVIAAGRTFRHTAPDPTTRSQTPAFYGFEAFFENVDGISDQIELDMIPGGYIGIVRQDNAVNVCGLVDLDTFRRAGANLDDAMRFFSASNPLLQQRMRSANRVSDWQSVGPVRIGKRRLVDGHTFFVGDAACVVDPFAGEGVAMGLATGRVLRQAFAAPESERAARYHQLWHARFDSAIRLQRFICWGVQYPLWQEMLTRICVAFPGIMRRLTDGTRPAVEHRMSPAS